MTRVLTNYMVVVHVITGDGSRRLERQFFVHAGSERAALDRVKAIVRNQGGYVDDSTERPLVQRAELADEHEDYVGGYREERTGEFGRGTVSEAQEGE